MELVKIATGEPITRAQIEAEWLAAQPASVLVEQMIDGENGPELALVETPNHPEFPLPEDLWRFDLTPYGVAIANPMPAPDIGPDEVAERDGVENVAGVWQYKWTIRPMTAAEKKARVPVAITARQARIVLSRHGYLPAVETALSAMTGQEREEARIEWEYAAEFRRDHPLIAAIGALLELDDDTIDALFIEAAAII